MRLSVCPVLLPSLCPHLYMDAFESPCGLSCAECDIVGVSQPVLILVLPQEVGEAALPQRLFEVVLAPLAVCAIKLL